MPRSLSADDRALRGEPIERAPVPDGQCGHQRDRAEKATGPGGPVRLTPTEWHLLEILLRNPSTLVSQKQLLAEVWGPSYQKETNYLRVYLAQLRRKLEADPSQPRHLITEPGVGYRFEP